jgi:hypothetical protein
MPDTGISSILQVVTVKPDADAKRKMVFQTSSQAAMI